MEPLTATQQATLDALNDEPATSAEIRERTGRSRSATDKALADLAGAGLAAKAPADGESDGPARWIRIQAQVDGQVSDTHEGEPISSPEQSGESDTVTESLDLVVGEEDRAEQEHVDHELTDDAPAATDQRTSDDAPEVKLCRGCQNQMPVTCPCCWQRTPGYCGECRKKMPARQRGNPGEPEILANGLPKLTKGQLEELVVNVMREQPLPHHVGVTGWTSGGSRSSCLGAARVPSARCSTASSPTGRPNS